MVSEAKAARVPAHPLAGTVAPAWRRGEPGRADGRRDKRPRPAENDVAIGPRSCTSIGGLSPGSATNTGPPNGNFPARPASHPGTLALSHGKPLASSFADPGATPEDGRDAGHDGQMTWASRQDDISPHPARILVREEHLGEPNAAARLPTVLFL